MAKKLTTAEFIERAKLAHGDKYNYEKVEYINSQTKVCIICPTHGEFWQIPRDHYTGCGCNKCRKSKSKEFDPIDRKTHMREYSIWASQTTQTQNRGEFNKLFTYNGKTMVLKEWSRELGIKYTTLYQRIYRSGLSFEEAIQKDPFKRQIEINGEKHNLKEWTEIYGIKYQTVVDRINKHKWDIVDAITIPVGTKRSEIKI